MESKSVSVGALPPRPGETAVRKESAGLLDTGVGGRVRLYVKTTHQEGGFCLVKSVVPSKTISVSVVNIEVVSVFCPPGGA